MVESLLKLATASLAFLTEKERSRYANELLEIKKEILNEENKIKPDDLIISKLHFKLMFISDSITTAINSKKT